MNAPIQRREFLKTAGALGSATGLAGLGVAPLLAGAPQVANAVPHADKLGWRLGCLFNCFAPPILYGAVEQVSSLGLRYLEGGSRPAVSAKMPAVHLDASTPRDVRQALKSRLAAAGVKLVSYYTYKRSPAEAEWRKEFEFARDMGIEILVAEPDPGALDVIERLCDEYQICLAVHNHPAPSHYWNYQTVLDLCRNRSWRIGVCGDTGHWVRSGIDPVEAIKRVEGRIISFHLKDLDQCARDAQQVAWGTGKGKVEAVLSEVHRQGAKPLFIMEYERPVSRSEIVQCITFFDQVAGKLAGRQ